MDIVSLPSHPDYGIIIGIGRASVVDLAPRGNRYIVGVKSANDAPMAVQTSPPPYRTADAHFIDIKMDDGQSLKGRVLSVEPALWKETNFLPSIAAPSATCLSDTNNNYNLNETAPLCALMIKTDF